MERIHPLHEIINEVENTSQEQEKDLIKHF